MALSLHNTDILLDIGTIPFPAQQEVFANASATSQATALPLIGPVTRVLSANANQAFVLPQTQPGGSGSPSPIYFLVNDSAASVNVFCAVAATGNIAESMTVAGTTTANGSMAVPAGQTGIFAMVNSNRHARGGGELPAANTQLGWTGAVLT